MRSACQGSRAALASPILLPAARGLPEALADVFPQRTRHLGDLFAAQVKLDEVVVDVEQQVADARIRSLPKAYVVPAQEVPARELIEYVATRVAPYKQIHDLAFVDAIPTSPSGKTLRRLLVAADRERT